jgi:hypothetical protein
MTTKAKRAFVGSWDLDGSSYIHMTPKALLNSEQTFQGFKLHYYSIFSSNLWGQSISPEMSKFQLLGTFALVLSTFPLRWTAKKHFYLFYKAVLTGEGNS